MALNDAQLVTLRADIDANSGPGGEWENVPMNADGDQLISDDYGLVGSPLNWVLIPAVPVATLNLGIDYQEFVDVTAVTEGQRAGYGNLTRTGEDFDAGSEENRDALLAIFTPSAPNTRSGILDNITRPGLRGENLYAINATGPGGGDGSGQQQAQELVVVGEIARRDVSAARALP